MSNGHCNVFFFGLNTYLREDYDHLASLGELNFEECVKVLARPGNAHAGPLLRHSPVRTEQSCPVEMLVLFQQIFV